ncbi:Ribosome biogenesis protein [Salix suchowensis]|nr:Ribosome biogenesis protein [Salix suchowensis]
MVVVTTSKDTRKRKQAPQEEVTNEQNGLNGASNLEMHSDDEDGEEIGSDDGEVEDFPEIDVASDSEEAEESEEEVEEEDESEEGDSEDSDLHIFPKPKTIVSDITGRPKRVYPEIEPDYDSDSSTEDQTDTKSRGDVPMHWYDDLPHIGYDINGKQVLRPARGDELDKFLKTVDDPDAWTSAFDKNMQGDKALSPQELDIIRRLYEGENPDWFTGKGKEEVMPLSAAPEPKRRWIGSKWEKKKIMKIVRAIRQGRIIANKPKTKESKFQFYSIWSEPPSSHPPPLPAPKPPLPTNSESYNPPEEYLPTDAERAEWQATDPEDRERDYLPQKYSSLRLVPGYDQFIKERFNRQLDLYLLPSPSSLKPFPIYKSLTFAHARGRVRALSISPDGAWALSVNVGKEIKRWKFECKIGSLDWCPRSDVTYFVVATLPPPSAIPSPVKWVSNSSSDLNNLALPGDYMSTVSSGGVWIHQISRRHSQAPFKKTQQYVRLYNLSEQKLLKTLMPGIRWISSMDVHPSGDHLIVGGYDRKLCWFDLELSDKPYKVMRWCNRQPWLISSGADGAVNVWCS